MKHKWNIFLQWIKEKTCSHPLHSTTTFRDSDAYTIWEGIHCMRCEKMIQLRHIEIIYTHILLE